MYNKLWAFTDSYRHYRDIMKFNVAYAFYRACYYEIKHKEPFA